MNFRLLILAAITAALTTPASSFAKIVEQPVTYSGGNVSMQGYLVYDDSVQGKRPGILVVHEWWGLNDYVRGRARMLAELGYTALAVDMYGEGKVATHPDDAGKFSSAVMKNFDTAKARFTAAADFLRKQPMVDPNRIAAVGYCFGGGVALNMAAQGAYLKGVVSFHGTPSLIEPPKPGAVTAKILVLHGGADKMATQEQLDSFKQAMTKAKADYRIVVYPDAMHAFTNPAATAVGKKFNIPIGYNEKADKESWAEMKKFLSGLFPE
jgi:dienelactone hydrolase